MTLTVLLSLALIVIAAIIITWSLTYCALRRRMDALHRHSRRLQGEIELRMQLVQAKYDLKNELVAAIGGSAAQSHARTANRAQFNAAAHAHGAEPGPSAGDGRRGELTLERVISIAGLDADCEFLDPDPGGSATPDAIVHMPQARVLAIDAQAPLAAYDTAMQTGAGEQRRHAMAHFAGALRERVATLASTPLGRPTGRTPELVVLFLPSEQLLNAALDVDPHLQADAFQRGVVVATPTHLVALLHMIALGWRQHAAAASAQRMRAEAVRVCQQLRRFTEHLVGDGRERERHVGGENVALGALEQQLPPAARHLAEEGVAPKPAMSEAGCATRGVGTPAGDGGGGGARSPRANDDAEPPR